MTVTCMTVENVLPVTFFWLSLAISPSKKAKLSLKKLQEVHSRIDTGFPA